MWSKEYTRARPGLFAGFQSWTGLLIHQLPFEDLLLSMNNAATRQGLSPDELWYL